MTRSLQSLSLPSKSVHLLVRSTLALSLEVLLRLPYCSSLRMAFGHCFNQERKKSITLLDTIYHIIEFQTSYSI